MKLPPLVSRHTRRACLAVGLCATALGLWGCSNQNAAPTSRFQLLDGTTLHSDTLQGKVTLVNFWATTCVSCVKEMPSLVTTHQKYHAQGFETIAVAMSYDPPQWVSNFASTRKLPFKVAIDSTGELAKNWGDVKLTPTTYIVDKQGKIIKRFVGEPDFTALHQLIEKLLAQR